MRRRLFQFAQVLVIVLGVLFAILWIEYPSDHHFDAYAAACAALLPLFELLKRRFSDDGGEAQLKRWLQEALEQRTQAAAQAPPSSAPGPGGSAASPATAPDPLAQLFLRVIEQRNELEARLKEYARTKEIDSSGSAAQVLARLPFSQSDKGAIQGFLAVVNDFGHQPLAMVEWAANNGYVYINLVNLRLKA